MNKSNRILIVDDNPAIHEDFKKILIAKVENTELNSMEAFLFDEEEKEKEENVEFIIDDAYQGEEAINMVEKANEEGNPYALIYMDVRMPPGIDGIETIDRIWKKYPFIEMVICTAYSDYSWDDILHKFGRTDKLFFVKKPFNVITIKQLTLSLTTKVQLAQENREHMNLLEKEVKERTFELQELVNHLTELKRKAEESNRLKSAFLANISHEIRSPLNVILGFSELLTNAGFDKAKREEFVRYINNSGTMLLNLIDDIISIAKIESGQMRIQPQTVDLEDLMVEVHYFYASKVQNVNMLDVVLEIPEDLKDFLIVTDPHRLKQVITNLLNNSFKFTKKGYIKFGFTFENDEILFYVKDTGVGIPKDKQEVIFERFGQAHETNYLNKEGTGIGLTISQKLVELMGGRIWVESEMHRGAEFFFTQPLIKADPNTLLNKPKQLVENMLLKWPDKNILVVENDETSYLLIEEMLYFSEVAEIWAKSGKMAIELVKTDLKIDLILLDIKLGDINGKEVFKKIKRIRPDIPIIAETVFTQDEERIACLELGFADYLTKPISKKKLMDALNEVFSKSKK